jgi:hypothetical protein
VALEDKYGPAKIVHRLWPDNYMVEQEQMIRLLEQIAADPDIKALIINQAATGTIAAVDKLLQTRSDMLLVAIEPAELLMAAQPAGNPIEIAKRYSLILSADYIGMGYAMPAQAQKMGAKTFIHLSFPRHMSRPMIAARYGILKEECERLGLSFVSHTVPDPMGDAGMPGLSQFTLEDIPKMVEQYGQDTAFFGTNCGIQILLIKRVVESSAIFVQPCCPSPYHGFPLALGLMSEEHVHEGSSLLEAVGSPADAIAKTAAALAEGGALGRFSNWPVTSSMMFTESATAYAIKWLNGEVPQEGIDYAVLEQCMSDYAGVAVTTRTLGSLEADAAICDEALPNWAMVLMDYFIYGEEHK